MLRSLFIGCLVVVVILIAVAAGFGFYVYRQFQSVFEIPVELDQPSVLVGEGFLSSEVLFSDPGLGSVFQIAPVDFDGDGVQDLVLVGSVAAAILDGSFESKSTITYSQPPNAKVILTDLEPDGTFEFLVRGSWQGPVRVFDHDGTERWSYSGASGIDDAAAGDVDGDGDLEVVVGMNGGGGIHLLDSDGSVLWTQSDGNVWRVETLSPQSGTRLDIVHSNAAGQITVRSATGQILSQMSPGPYFSDFSKTEWIDLEGNDQLLLAEDDQIWVFDRAGKTLAQWKAPLAGGLGEVEGRWIDFSGRDSALFACLVTFDTWGRSILYLFDSDGTILYQEVLGTACYSIEKLDGALLLGGNGELLRYRVTEADTGP